MVSHNILGLDMRVLMDYINVVAGTSNQVDGDPAS